MTHASLAHSDVSRSAFSFRRAAALLALIVFAAGFSGCDKLKARDLLNKGVAAFKNGQYDTAVEDFKQAKDLDPFATQRAPVSRHRLRQPVHSRRSIRTEPESSAKQAIAEFKEILQHQSRQSQRD